MFEELENLSHHPNQERQPGGERADLCRWGEHLCCLVPQEECDDDADEKQIVDNSYQTQMDRRSIKVACQQSFVVWLHHHHGAR